MFDHKEAFYFKSNEQDQQDHHANLIGVEELHDEGDEENISNAVV